MSEEEEELPPFTPDEETDIYFVFLMDEDAVRSANSQLLNQVTLDENKINEMTNSSAVFIQELRQWMERNQINGALNIHQFRAMINASSMDYRRYISTEIGGLDRDSKVFYREQIRNLPRRVTAPSITTSVASFARENIDGNTPLRIMGRFALPIQVFFTGRNHTSLEVNFLAGSFANPGMIQPKIPVGTQTGQVRVISNGIELRPFTLTIDEPTVQPAVQPVVRPAVQPVVRPAVTGADVRPDVQPVRPGIRTGDVVNGRIVPPPRQPPTQSGLSGPGPSGPGPQSPRQGQRSPGANLSSDDEDAELQQVLLSQIENRVNGQPSGPELANLSSDDEYDEDAGLQEVLLSQIHEPITTLDQLVSAMFNKIDLDGSGAINIAEIYEFINILPPLEEVHFFTTELSANDEVRRKVVEYIDDNGDLSLAKFKEFIEGIANNLHSDEDRNYFYQFLINYVRPPPPPPPPPVVVQLPSEIVFQAIAGGQETITVGQIRDFLIQAGVPVRIVAQIITTNYGRDSEENILSQTDFTNRFFDFTQPVQDTLLNYATTVVPVVRPAPVVPGPIVRPAPVVPGPVVRPEPTKEEIQEKRAAEVKIDLENRALLLREQARRAFNSPIPGLTGRFRNITYKQFTEMTKTTNPDSDIHHSYQNDLAGTIAVLENYYQANAERVETTEYNRTQIFNDLFRWLQASEEFNLPAPVGVLKGYQKRNIDLNTRRRMVEYVMSCIDEHSNDNGTTYDTSVLATRRGERINVDSEKLLNLIYTFIKGQPEVPDFRSVFAAAFVRGIIESYEATSDPNGVSIYTYGQNPNARPACRAGGTHYMLPMFDQALHTVFGESPPEKTEEEKEVMRKPEQTRKINEWLEQGFNQPNSTANSVQAYIYRRIREERGNPEQWRATSGNDELTVRQLIDRMGLFGGKRRNKRQTKRVKPNGVKTKSKAKTNPLKKRTRKI